MSSGDMNIRIKGLLGEMPKKALFRFMRPFSNSFILLNPLDRAKNNRVNLGYWSESPNLGDAISPVVVNHLLKSKGLSLDTEIAGRRHLYAVGSVITAGAQDCTVWGSGILNPKLLYRVSKRRLDIRAVRGPVTRSLLMEYGYEVPSVYGDPAVFLPEIYSPTEVSKECRYGFVVHKDGSSRFSNADNLKGGHKFIDIKTTDYRKFVDELVSVECVISTSLHGIILAESYGVPAILMMPKRDFMKYEDWYEATNRATHPVALSLDEIESITPAPIPVLDEMRERLRASFPYDLFEKPIGPVQ